MRLEDEEDRTRVLATHGQTFRPLNETFAVNYENKWSLDLTKKCRYSFIPIEVRLELNGLEHVQQS